MFLVFGTEEESNLLYVGVIAGHRAAVLQHWLDGRPANPQTVLL